MGVAVLSYCEPDGHYCDSDCVYLHFISCFLIFICQRHIVRHANFLLKINKVLYIIKD